MESTTLLQLSGPEDHHVTAGRDSEVRVLLVSCLAVGGCLTLEGGDVGADRPTPSGPDRVEVVSSSLKVLPRRRERRTAATSWRKPRDYEFVTREGGRSPRRLPYPEEDNLPPQDYFERRRDYPNRRIIYYASLPDVVRRPGEWTPPRPIYYPPPSPAQNEIVTRVQSGLIDVSNPNNNPINYNNKYPESYNNKYPESYNNKYPESYTNKYPDSYNKYPDRFGEELPPRFTIIDAEPPYNRPPYPPPHPLRDYDRYDYRRHDYNRYDYRNHVEPYRSSYYEPHPYRHQQLPAQPVTVVRHPVEISRPLDVRPLVPLHPLSTQAPPVASSSTTEPTSTTSASHQDLSNFERAFKSSSS